MVTNNELEPCYSCPRGCRVWLGVGVNGDGYESVVCQCPIAGVGCDNCTDPGAILIRIGGASQ